MRREEEQRKKYQNEILSKNSLTKSTKSKNQKNKIKPENKQEDIPKEKKSRCTIL